MEVALAIVYWFVCLISAFVYFRVSAKTQLIKGGFGTSFRWRHPQWHSCQISRLPMPPAVGAEAPTPAAIAPARWTARASTTPARLRGTIPVWASTVAHWQQDRRLRLMSRLQLRLPSKLTTISTIHTIILPNANQWTLSSPIFGTPCASFLFQSANLVSLQDLKQDDCTTESMNWWFRSYQGDPARSAGPFSIWRADGHNGSIWSRKEHTA